MSQGSKKINKKCEVMLPSRRLIAVKEGGACIVVDVFGQPGDHSCQRNIKTGNCGVQFGGSTPRDSTLKCLVVTCGWPALSNYVYLSDCTAADLCRLLLL